MNKSGQRKKTIIPRNARAHKAQRRDQILEAAFQVFAVKGYAEARLDDVARQAGIAKGTIYLYFKDKEQLFRAVARSLIQKRFDSVVGDFRGTASELLRELVARMYSQVVRNDKARSIIRMLISEGTKFPQLAEIYHREIIAPGIKAVRTVLKRGIDSGEFRRTQATEFPQILAAPGVLAMIWRLLLGERHHLDLDAYMKAHVELVLSSLQSRDVPARDGGA